jgi:hypothetical protein
LDRLAGPFIDEPLAQAVAGGFVDLAECDPLGGRGAAWSAIGQETKASLR